MTKSHMIRLIIALIEVFFKLYKFKKLFLKPKKKNIGLLQHKFLYVASIEEKIWLKVLRLYT